MKKFQPPPPPRVEKKWKFLSRRRGAKKIENF
jgi:hypothetical protein